MGRGKREGEGSKTREEREKFECGFEEIGRRSVITEIGKRVVKIFLIFERELYTFVMIGMIWRVRRGEIEVN